MFYLRRVQGRSMLPNLPENSIVLAVWYWPGRPVKPNDVVIVRHNGLEKIKRIRKIELDKIYVLGDNSPESTDSRHFGWLAKTNIKARIIWPKHKLHPPVRQIRQLSS